MRVARDDGPLRALDVRSLHQRALAPQLHGHLRALAPCACKIEFALGYEFDSLLVRSAAGVVFDRITGTFVDAFIARAEALFGPAAKGIASTPAGPGPLVGPAI